MKLSQLKGFLAVVDSSSFSEAALDLGVSQAAISHSVAELENELGIKLLDRGRFGARPTRAALGIIEHARKILQSEAAINQEVALHKGLVKGRLRVGVFHSVAYHLMPPLMKRLGEKYPQLDIVMFEPVMPNSQSCIYTYVEILQKSEVDASFIHLSTPNTPKMENVLSWKLFTDPYVAVVPQEFSRNRLSLKDLQDYPIIVEAEKACEETISDFLRQEAPGVTPKYFIQDEAALLNMTAQGLGISILAKLAITHLPAGLRIVDLPTPLERTIAIGVHSANFKVPAVRAFLSVLKEFYPESELPSLSLGKEVVEQA
ncbi:MAG: LysR family transcriptional regulator [Trueperaceae bacterium]|nr:LysR family transcriptional regulator [Trueperaceae bacterium]